MPASRKVALGLGAAAVVAGGLGAFLVAEAVSKNHDSLAFCPNDPGHCTHDGVQLRHDALAAGNGATITLSIGAAALAAGAILWLLAPSKPAPATRTGRLEVHW
jgi:hypothetical protein